MGLFNNLFEKKICSICGNEIKFLGNRKVEDGNMCKSCASKLSHWFSDRRKSTVEDIKAQLAYREENQAQLENFNVTRTLGKNGYTLYIDESQGKFFVYGGNNWKEANPDIISFSQVLDCRMDIDEGRTEVRKQERGKPSESFNPPRYSYYWNFGIKISVNHPWFNEMNFNINSSSISDGIDDDIIRNAPHWMPKPPAKTQEYAEYEVLGRDIVTLLLTKREENVAATLAANAPKQAVNCPHCGATTIPDANGCCEYCGSAVNA